MGPRSRITPSRGITPPRRKHSAEFPPVLSEKDTQMHSSRAVQVHRKSSSSARQILACARVWATNGACGVKWYSKPSEYHLEYHFGVTAGSSG